MSLLISLSLANVSVDLLDDMVAVRSGDGSFQMVCGKCCSLVVFSVEAYVFLEQ